MISVSQIPFLVPTLLRFCSSDAEDVLAFDKYCLEMLNLDSLPIVKDVVSESEKFIAVYRNKNDATALEDSGSPPKEISDESDLELTGCPLECPFPMNDSVFDCSLLSNSRNGGSKQGEFSPLTLSDAHAVLRIFNEVDKYLRKEKETFMIPLVVVLCDAGDSTSTRALGWQRLIDSTKRFRITSKECVPVANLPKMETVKRNHLWGTSSTAIDVNIKAKYVVLVGSKKSLEDQSESEVVLECEWKSALKLLEVPSSEAKCIVHFSIVLGDNRSPAYSKWKELMLLEELVENFDSNSSTWTREKSETSVVNNLRQLMSNLKTAINKKMNKTERKCEEFDLAGYLIEDRKNMDFTEKLWSVLKDCESCEELQNCFEIVFDHIMDEEIKPVLFSRNRSKFGILISEIYHKKCEVPHVSSRMALEYLIEIGIEKLKQDYMHLFLVSGIATKDVLDSFTTFRDANFKDQLLSLKKLHLITEIIALTDDHLNSSQALLCSYARMAINRIYDLEYVGKLHSFAFPINRQLIVDYFTDYLPHVWILVMESNEKSYNNRTACRLSIDDPGKNENNKKQIKIDDADIEGLYHVSFSTLVSDKM